MIRVAHIESEVYYDNSINFIPIGERRVATCDPAALQLHTVIADPDTTVSNAVCTRKGETRWL